MPVLLRGICPAPVKDVPMLSTVLLSSTVAGTAQRRPRQPVLSGLWRFHFESPVSSPACASEAATSEQGCRELPGAVSAGLGSSLSRVGSLDVFKPPNLGVIFLQQVA